MSRLGDARLPARFWDKVNVVDGCWRWAGATDAKGYARFAWQGKNARGHALSYASLVGPIPAGLELDHLCRVRACVNPEHLEPVTHAENMRRARKSHCAHGHPMTPDNVYSCWVERPSGREHQRYCRQCGRRNNAASAARKRRAAQLMGRTER